MGETYLLEFAGAYLEDSYFLGVLADGEHLRLKCLFALTVDHPDYAPPKPNEAHCYREGSIVVEHPSVVQWKPGRQTINKDLDGSFDFGFVQLNEVGPNRFRIITEWFEAVVEADHLRLELSDANV